MRAAQVLAAIVEACAVVAADAAVAVPAQDDRLQRPDRDRNGHAAAAAQIVGIVGAVGESEAGEGVEFRGELAADGGARGVAREPVDNLAAVTTLRAVFGEALDAPTREALAVRLGGLREAGR